MAPHCPENSANCQAWIHPWGGACRAQKRKGPGTGTLGHSKVRISRQAQALESGL